MSLWDCERALSYWASSDLAGRNYISDPKGERAVYTISFLCLCSFCPARPKVECVSEVQTAPVSSFIHGHGKVVEIHAKGLSFSNTNLPVPEWERTGDGGGGSCG